MDSILWRYSVTGSGGFSSLSLVVSLLSDCLSSGRIIPKHSEALSPDARQ